MAVKGQGYTKTTWAFAERPVASGKLNSWDDRIEAALEVASLNGWPTTHTHPEWAAWDFLTILSSMERNVNCMISSASVPTEFLKQPPHWPARRR